MMLALILLYLLYKDWQARRKLEARIKATAGAQIAAAELSMQFQREQFEQHEQVLRQKTCLMA